MVELVWAGRMPRELEPSYETFRNWARQVERDEDRSFRVSHGRAEDLGKNWGLVHFRD